MSNSTSMLSGVFRPFVQLSGFVRKELMEILRQPRLLLVMVVGPFLVLALFAVGFDQQRTVLDTKFVAPEGSIYEASIEEFDDELSRYVNNAGFTSDLIAAEQELRSGDIDLIVIFPNDPTDSVLSGEQAVIDVIHDKIDPIQQVSVEVSTQVAVQELNAAILERVVGEAQSAIVPYQTSLDESLDLLVALSAAVEEGDGGEVARITGDLERSTGALSTIVDISNSVAIELNGNSEQRAELDDLSTSTRDLETAVEALADDSENLSVADVAAVQELFDGVATAGETVTTLDPRIVVRPFTGDTASLQRSSVAIEDFFAPAAIALLLQHMVLTFAAMSLVSDRSLGLFELFRVGPVGSGRILLGKYISYLLIGGAVAGALLAAVRFGLGVPVRGNVWWLVLGVIGLLVASVGLGTLISLFAKSDTQAVQYALLALLAGLFFSGFFLDLDAFSYPVKAIAWTMPVTYGVRVLRDVMLRGNDPATIDMIGLAVTAAVYVGLSWYFLARRMRVR